jgi:hypothetical protein
MRSSNSQRRWQGPFPDWIPACVRELAQVTYNDVNRHGVRREDIALLRRLSLDSRMKLVWDELLKKKRIDYKRTQQYVYPVQNYDARQFWSFHARLLQARAESPGGSGEDADSKRNQTRALLFEMEVPNTFSRLTSKLGPQEKGLVWLFHMAFSLARKTPRSVSVADKRKAAHRFRTMAKQIRADAAEQRRMCGFADRRLLEAGFAYDELADDAAGSLGPTLLVSRKPRWDARLKGFVIALASTTKLLFGVPLFGTVATLANVVLDRRDLTDDKVRKMIIRTPRP